MENPFKIILEKLDSIEKLKAASNDDEDFMATEQESLSIGLAKPTVYGLVH